MKRIGGVKNLLFILFAFITIGSFYSSLVTNASVNNVEERINSIPLEPKVVVYKSKDGYTPVRGVDYFDGAAGIAGKNGVDGKDAVSTVVNTTETVVKEVPIVGPKGDKGDPAPSIEYRIDEYGNFQTKNSDDDLWQLLIPCDKFVGGCTE